MDKKFNRQITVAGIIIFIPAVLFAGGFAGYAVGEYCRLPPRLKFLLMLVFFAAAVGEAVRLIKFAWKISK